MSNVHAKGKTLKLVNDRFETLFIGFATLNLRQKLSEMKYSYARSNASKRVLTSAMSALSPSTCRCKGCASR